MPTRRHLAAAGLASAALLLLTAACGTVPGGQAGGSTSQNPASGGASSASAPSSASSTASSPPAPTATPTTAPVKLHANVDDGATKVKVDTLVSVKASAGTVSKVGVDYSYVEKGVTKKGTLGGTLNKAKTKWTASSRLEPAGSYRVKMTGKNSAGESSTSTSSFKTQTLALSQQVFPEIYPLRDSKVGVGMPAIVRFDVPVTDKASIQKNLHVISSPAQAGSWHWYSDREVHWRPKSYWKAGTKVSIKADINGVDAGNGIYGQKSTSSSFTVGRSFVIKVNLSSDHAKVYENGKKVRTIAVTGGKAGWETRSGTKLIMAKEYNKVMTNEMIGAKEKYRLTAAYAMRITNSGEFLHSAPWNAANLGVRNASHGCTGMGTADARWLIENTLIGDPVVTTGSNRGIEPGNGYTDWNASFKEYAKGSAV